MSGQYDYSGNGIVFWYGQDLRAEMIEDVPAEVKFDNWGIAGASLDYNCDFDTAPTFVYGCLFHPFYPWLQRKTASIKREEANLGKVTLNFEGIPPQTNDIKYKLSGSTSSEPIDSHQKFATNDMAGPVYLNITSGQIQHATAYPSAGAATMYVGQNGACFDLKGTFTGFAVSLDGTTLNPFAGIKDYLMAGVMYEQVWTRGYDIGSPSDLENLGYIDNPPSDPGGSQNSYADILPIVEGRNWLLITADLELIGFGSRLTRKWRMSGYRGWNSVIYTAPTS